MQKKIKFFFICGLLIVSGIFMSFQGDKDDTSLPFLSIQQLIDNAVEKKLNQYRRIRINKCNSTRLEEAARRADSIVISRIKALNVVQDTSNRPPAPDRPLRPESLAPIDSSAAAPLLGPEKEDTSSFDLKTKDIDQQF